MFLRVDAGCLYQAVLNLGQFCHPKRVCGNVLRLAWENWLLKTFVFIYFWLCWVFAVAAHGLSLVAVSRGYSLVGVCGPVFAMVSLVAEHRLYAHRLQ